MLDQDLKEAYGFAGMARNPALDLAAMSKGYGSLDNDCSLRTQGALEEFFTSSAVKELKLASI